MEQLVYELPIDRVVKIHPKMKQHEIKKAYLETFYDRIETDSKADIDRQELLEEMADVKIKLRQSKDEEERKQLQEKFESLKKLVKR